MSGPKTNLMFDYTISRCGEGLLISFYISTLLRNWFDFLFKKVTLLNSPLLTTSKYTRLLQSTIDSMEFMKFIVVLSFLLGSLFGKVFFQVSFSVPVACLFEGSSLSSIPPYLPLYILPLIRQLCSLYFCLL